MNFNSLKQIEINFLKNDFIEKTHKTVFEFILHSIRIIKKS